jgi:hypothetical protein
MKPQFKRICIYPKDIVLVTGKSYRQSVRLLNGIRANLNKSAGDFVTIEEFCNAVGLRKEDVEPLIFG